MPFGSLYLKWKYKFTPEKRQEEMSLNLQKDRTNVFLPAYSSNPAYIGVANSQMKWRRE